MEPVRTALVGCGGMSSAHVGGLEELRRAHRRPLDIVAVCDPDTDRARERAAQVAEVQGSQPAVYERLEYLLGSGPELEAVDICTLHSAHHEVAVPCLEAGLAVLIEKPLAVTMRAARRIVDAATRSRSLLAVAEQYRRSPEERARHWAVRRGRIGRPRTFYWQDVSESLGKWGWRSFRQHSGGGWVLDGGVHFADLFRYHLGLQPREVFAVTRQFEPFRYDDAAARAGSWRVDVEDSSHALVSFEDDVVVQWTWQGSAPGQGFRARVLYGSEGCLDWETGLWGRQGEHLSNEELVAEFRGSLDEEAEEQLFPGGVTHPVAVELVDFARAVRSEGRPEVDGMEGFKAQAICAAVYESGWHGRPVTLREIERCELEGYQAGINAGLGIE